MKITATLVSFALAIFPAASASAAASGPSAAKNGEDISGSPTFHTNATLEKVGPGLPNPEACGDVTVTYCSSRSQGSCGGTCTTYTGGATCLEVSDVECIFASANVAFCDGGGCGGDCNTIDSCGTRLDGDACYTPGTASITVPCV